MKKFHKIKIKTDKLFTDITDEVAKFIPPDEKNGIMMVYCPHTTASITLLEYELLHLVDIRFFLDKIAPKYKEPEGDQKNIKYLHDLISLRANTPEDERINGHSHIRSLFFNSSELIPFEDNKLKLGEWKKVFFVELDPVREREIYVISL